MIRVRLFLLAIFLGAGFYATPALAEGCFSDVGNTACNTKTRAVCLEDPTCYWGSCVAVDPVNQTTCNTRTECLNSAVEANDGLCRWNKEQGMAQTSSGPSGGNCFCSDDYKQISIENYTNTSFIGEITRSECVNLQANQCSISSAGAPKKASGARYVTCQSYTNTQLCQEAARRWDTNKAAQIRAAEQGKKGSEVNGVLSRFIPECALYEDGKLTDECKDVGIFVVLLLNITRYLFSIIGALALLVFIYGGFILIISQGNSEQIEKGKSAMTAAIIGLIVAFSAYLLINFIGGVVGVSSEFLLK